MAGINTLSTATAAQDPVNEGTAGIGVRGIHEMLGIVYAVIGEVLYTVNPGGGLTFVTNGIAGTGFVRMVDNTRCMVILIPGTYQAYFYVPSTGAFGNVGGLVASLGAVDCAYVDNYIVFLALSGIQFYNDDGANVSGAGNITFTTNAVFTREFGTDLFVGMTVDHREVLMFGKLTSEGYVNAGNPTGTPFASAPDSFMTQGCHPDAAYSIAIQDQAVIWLANDRTIRRRNGQTPVRISNSGIENSLENMNLAGCYALTPTIAGHPLWVLIIPGGPATFIYDCLTQEWFEHESLGLGRWRALSYANAFGRQLIGDALSGSLGFLDTSVFTEFGVPIVARIFTQSVYSDNNPITHRRVEAVMTAGRADKNTPYISNTLVTLLASDDGGNTYFPFDQQQLGALGQYDSRAFWLNTGSARNRVYELEVSDPTPLFTVDLTSNYTVNQLGGSI